MIRQDILKIITCLVDNDIINDAWDDSECRTIEEGLTDWVCEELNKDPKKAEPKMED